MAQTKAIVDKLLTNASKAYVPQGYISDMILPVIKKKQSSGLLGGYTNQHLRIVNTVMGGRGKARRMESIVRDSQGYVIENHGLEGLVTKDDFDNVEQPFDAEKDEALGLVTMLWLGREKALADVLGDTSILTQNTTLSGTSQWSDFTNSDPIGDMKVGRQAVYEGSGMAPNLAIISWEVFNCLAYHPQILNNLGFAANRAGQLSSQEIAKAAGVDRLLIGNVRYNNAKEGATDALTSVWGKNFVYAVAPKTAQKYQVSLGYTIRKTGETPNQVFKSDEKNPPGSKSIIVTNNYDDLLSNVNAAYLIKDSVA